MAYPPGSLLLLALSKARASERPPEPRALRPRGIRGPSRRCRALGPCPSRGPLTSSRVTGWRNQARSPRQKLRRRHHDVRRSRLPRLAKQIGNAAIGQARKASKALQAERRARAVPAHSLESFAIARAHRDAGVNVEAGRFRDPRALGRGAEAVVAPRHGHAASREAQEGASEEGQRACTLRAAKARALRSSGLLPPVRRRGRDGAATASCASRRARRCRRSPRARGRAPRER
jgi:hypothetical protein